MSRLRDLVRQDWDDIGQSLLLAAAEAMAEAARKRANAHAGAIRIERQSESKVTISISERMLVTRERGDATSSHSAWAACDDGYVNRSGSWRYISRRFLSSSTPSLVKAMMGSSPVP
jgi:hypothetical protein